MKTKLALTFVVLLAANSVLAQDKPNVPEVDRLRLAEAFRLGESLGDRVWKDWNKVPFAVVLVTPEYEFLIRHPRPSEDFTLIGYDPLLRSDVYFRKRRFPTSFLATFQAVGGVSTIIIGQAENTYKKTSTPWVVTVLHEHFHQLQDAQSDYFVEVEALNLSRGDQTGMWMLNYAFPYDAPEVKQQFVVLTRLLVEALQAKNQSVFSAKLAAYLEARQRLQKSLSPHDYKYLSFQLWKEGLARYTEIRMAKLAADKYEPSKEFRALKDFTSFAAVADQIMSDTLKELSTFRIENQKRELFYPLGGGEGLLLDRVNSKWQSRYFVDKFYIEKYFSAAR
ncbi:MAG: hypothetical protein H0T63_07750 [Pyrinomonadaceae bacterium]|nr:hypothetical protein [Pyrinomonadaceae bacterium]